MSYLVAKRYVFASGISDAEVETARVAREAIVTRMNEVLSECVVLCLPTTAMPSRPLNESLATRQIVQEGTYCLVSIAGTIGAPQINLPVADVDGLPIGLSLLGPRGSDEMLMALACELESGLWN